MYRQSHRFFDQSINIPMSINQHTNVAECHHDLFHCRHNRSSGVFASSIALARYPCRPMSLIMTITITITTSYRHNVQLSPLPTRKQGYIYIDSGHLPALVDFAFDNSRFCAQPRCASAAAPPPKIPSPRHFASLNVSSRPRSWRSANRQSLLRVSP